MTKSSRRLGAVALVLAVLVTQRASSAPRVALFRDAAGTNAADAEQQLRAELRAQGFEVIVIEHPSRPSANLLVVSAAELDAFAAVRLRADRDIVEASVWARGETETDAEWRHLSERGPEAARTLGLRVVEHLRARRIDLGLPEPRAPKASTKPDPSAPLPRDPAGEVPREARAQPSDDRSTRFRLAAGAALFVSPGGLGAAFAPALEASLLVARDLWLELRAAGPAFSEIGSAAGTATAYEALTVLGARVDLTTHHRFALFGSAAAGAHFLAAEGDPVAPNAGRKDSAFSLLLCSGLGVRQSAPLTPGLLLEFTLRTDAGLLAPEPVVRLAGDEVARLGRPLVLGSASMGARW